jgi:hydrogenase-4 component B
MACPVHLGRHPLRSRQIRGRARPDRSRVASGPGAVFLLSFFGFAVKAGLVPVNSWLPLAHPVAPTNVSALLSAVIVNLGIYGIIRFNLDLVPVTTSGPGLIVLVVGSFSALIGILYATVESEMKRLLAHSTIENMGIVAAGIGAAMIFLATGHQIVAGIALIAATYHLANHSVYKALLFLGTGAVEAGAHTRDLDRLGGISRMMPWTSAFFLIGVMAISALPPLNGFVSEWLTLQTVLRSVLLSSTPVKIVFAISGAMLALTAGLTFRTGTEWHLSAAMLGGTRVVDPRCLRCPV